MSVEKFQTEDFVLFLIVQLLKNVLVITYVNWQLVCLEMCALLADLQQKCRLQSWRV